MVLANEWFSSKRFSDRPKVEARISAMLNPNTNLQLQAQRIVFDTDLGVLLYNLYNNKQLGLNAVLHNLETKPLPAQRLWVEWPDAETSEHVRFGVLLEANFDARLLIPDDPHFVPQRQRPSDAALSNSWRFDIVMGHSSECMALLTGIITRGMLEPFDMLLTSFHRQIFDSADAISNVADFAFKRFAFALFLLSQPKVYSATVVTHHPKLQRSRIKNGKMPLLEYRRVKVLIGETVKRYQHTSNENDPVQTDGIIHRRYHHVLGHFRHYEGQRPHTTWIEPYYRGDPKIGVLIKEHDIVPPTRIEKETLQ